MDKRATLHVLPGVPHPYTLPGIGTLRAPTPPAADGRATTARPAPADDGPVRVGVMGDDPLARAGIRALLEGRPGVHVVSDDGASPHGARPPREPRPDVIVVHGRPGFTPEDVRAHHPGGTTALITIGGPPPEPATAWAPHSHLPATVTPGQLAAAVLLAAAGYTLTREQKPPHRTLAPSQVSQVSQVSPEHLTRREGEVLDLLASGMSNSEIAGSLSLSEHTVKTHVQNLMNKLRLRNRVHAAIYAYETGMRHPC